MLYLCGRTNIKVMLELQIFISKKGTRVVRATELYKALNLPPAKYATHIHKWLKDIYEFQDGLRKPENMRDFARRKTAEPLVEDYYLTLELAKHIALRSESSNKLKCARYLKSLIHLEGSDRHAALRELKALINLTSAMSKVSNQLSCERKHADLYRKRNNGSLRDWWAYRERLLGIHKEKWAGQVTASGRAAGGRSLRALLLAREPSELIRIGVFDWFMAQGKSPQYALNMAAIAKQIAQILQLEVEDDLAPATKALNLFSQVG